MLIHDQRCVNHKALLDISCGSSVVRFQFSVAFKEKISNRNIIMLPDSNHVQWRSQNAQTVTHVKGRLLDEAVILFNCIPLQNENFS